MPSSVVGEYGWLRIEKGCIQYFISDEENAELHKNKEKGEDGTV